MGPTEVALLRNVGGVAAGRGGAGTGAGGDAIDRLIAEMTALRSQVSALDFLPVQPDRSGDEADKLEQMEQAASDPLFMADLRETMLAFAGVDADI